MGQVHVGTEVPADTSRLQQLLAERQPLSDANPASPVRRTDWGYEQLPPEQSPSRFRHAGIGAGQGAIIAGQATQGDPWGTLAGTVIGALTGGISPDLIQAFTRRTELDRNAGELSTEQKLQLQNAQIGETVAQAEQRRMEPYLRAEELRAQNDRFEATEAGRMARAEASNKTRVQTAAEANKARQATLAETMRHNRAVEGRPTGTNERTVNGAIYAKDKDGVWRLAPGSPAPQPSVAQRRSTEKADDRTEKGRQAQSLYQKGSDYWDQAQQKREEARRLGAGPDGNPSRLAATRNEEAIRRLNREAEQLESKTREVQIRGDMLAAEAESGPASSGGGGRTLEGAVNAFRKKFNREPTAEETARMKKALGQ
jgi:hypothetical protein